MKKQYKQEIKYSKRSIRKGGVTTPAPPLSKVSKAVLNRVEDDQFIWSILTIYNGVHLYRAPTAFKTSCITQREKSTKKEMAAVGSSVFYNPELKKQVADKKIIKILDKLFAGPPVEVYEEKNITVDFRGLTLSTAKDLIQMFVTYKLKDINKEWLSFLQNIVLDKLPCIDKTTKKTKKPKKNSITSRGGFDNQEYDSPDKFEVKVSTTPPSGSRGTTQEHTWYNESAINKVRESMSSRLAKLHADSYTITMNRLEDELIYGTSGQITKNWADTLKPDKNE